MPILIDRRRSDEVWFNKDKKIARDFALYAIMLPEKQIQQINEILQEQDIQFSEIELDRLRLCLSILNLSSIFWHVNSYEGMGKIDINRVKKIINNTLDAFMNNFTNNRTTIRIGDYIVDNDEIILLDRELSGFSGFNITRETATTISTLVPAIYNIRIDQYNVAFNERHKRFFEERQGSLDPVVKIFTKHFIGENSQNYVQLVLILSSVLIPFDAVISNMVEDYLTK